MQHFVYLEHATDRMSELGLPLRLKTFGAGRVLSCSRSLSHARRPRGLI